ncbi:hypothetical protein AGIG_G10532 [Arapaima gigas]
MCLCARLLKEELDPSGPSARGGRTVTSRALATPRPRTGTETCLLPFCFGVKQRNSKRDPPLLLPCEPRHRRPNAHLDEGSASSRSESRDPAGGVRIAPEAAGSRVWISLGHPGLRHVPQRGSSQQADGGCVDKQCPQNDARSPFLNSARELANPRLTRPSTNQLQSRIRAKTVVLPTAASLEWLQEQRMGADGWTKGPRSVSCSWSSGGLQQPCNSQPCPPWMTTPAERQQR